MPKKAATADIHFHFLQPCPDFTKRNAVKDFIRLLFKKEKTQLQSLNYIFCSDDYLLEINKSYLSHNYYTDIITFDLSENQGTIGEIYISLDRVKDNAAQFNTSFKQELHRVIFHGALHLCGYKDKTKADSALMRKKEEQYLDLYFKA